MLSGRDRITLGGIRGVSRLLELRAFVDLDVLDLRARRLVDRNTLGEGSPGHHRVDSATKSERVKRLHQPPLRIRTLSEIQISDPVEQHDHAGVLEFTGRLVEA